VDVVIRNARVRGREELVDVGVEAGRIAAVEHSLAGATAREIDAAGRLVTPGFVNLHLHADKSLLGEVMRPNVSGTLPEAIAITNDFKRHYDPAEVARRAGRVVEAGIIAGTTFFRLFADVGTIGGLRAAQGLLAVRERYRALADVQVVAFPQEGILRDPGAEPLLREAMALGCDVVGGLPWYEYTDEEARQHVDVCLAIAREYDRDVHMLVDDTDDPNSRSLEYLALRTMREGFHGRVTASHCGALAAYDDVYAAKVIGMVAEAGITISSNTHISLVCSARLDREPRRRGIARVKELLAAGVNVVCAQDDVNDPYYPFGKPDQLEVALFMAHTAQLTLPDELETVFDMITANAARAAGLRGYGLAPGCQADLVVLDAPSVHEALRLQPPRLHVFKRGREVAWTRTTSELTRPPGE
jgi:cytosine/creatinine deaminase